MPDLPEPGRRRLAALLGRLERVDLPGGRPGPGWAWYCPGCASHHAVDDRWTVTAADTGAPTIVPSVVVRDAAGAVVCHAFIRAGVIEYLSDCRHPWAGSSVPMDPFDMDVAPPADTGGGF